MLSRGSFLEEKQGWYGETLISEMVKDTSAFLPSRTSRTRIEVTIVSFQDVDYYPIDFH